MRGLRTALLAAAVTAVATPALIARLHAGGTLDEPNHRSSHTTPTPRGGGLACAAGMAGATLTAAAAGHQVSWPALAGTLSLAAVGIVEDRSGLSTGARLVAQVGIGAALGGAMRRSAWAAMAGATLAPVLVNVTNFMDGINGITALTAGAWGATAMTVGVGVAHPPLLNLGAAVLGTGLGFLPFNAPQARVFLGDVGSYLYGGAFAAGALLVLDRPRAAVVTLAPLLPYLADTSTTLLRRARRGERLTEAHREHAYQRLVSESGWSHVQSATLVAGLAAASGGVARAWHRRCWG